MSPPAPSSEPWIARLASFQYRHPWVVVLLVVLAAVPAGLAALRLKLRTDWTELLPERKRSIVDLRRIQERVGGIGTLTVFLEGGSLAARQRLADDLAARVSRFPRDLVRWVDADLKAQRDFFEAHKFLYADLADLEEALVRLEEQLGRVKAEAAFDLGLDEDEPARSEPAGAGDLERLRARIEARIREADPFPSGYFTSADGSVLVVFVRSNFSSNQLALTEELLARVQGEVARLDPARYDPAIQVAYTGDLLTAKEEHDAVREDLVVVSVLCLSLILASIYLFYFEIRSILVLGAGVLVGLAWTFGLTQLRIGYLNSATAFLSSIVAGNGINSGIILIARYLEERRRHVPTGEALHVAMTGTWAATLIATAAASLSYGALVLTDFRGFNHFGFIGGLGLLLCWVAIYTLVPALLVLTDRLFPEDRIPKQRAWNYGRPFLAIAARAPLLTVSLSALLAGLGLVLGWRWVKGDPFEYDLLKLRNDRSVRQGAGRLQARVDELLSGLPREGMVIAVDREDQVDLVEQALERRAAEREKATGVRPIGNVRTLRNLMPADQGRKLVVLREIRDLALELLPGLEPARRAEVEPWVPPANLSAVTPHDLPLALRRPFLERDGRAGLLVHVSAPERLSLWDGRGLLEFASVVRTIQLANGEEIHASHRSVVFADMLEAILETGPALTLASLGAVLLLVFFTFRKITRTLLICLALVIGMGWMIGLMTLTTLGLPGLGWIGPIRLNFLNFIAIPITIGIGVDYSVNIVRRFMHEGWGSIDRVLLETGGAVVLCSLTTIWGYLSLLVSDNQALRSFGKLAVLGEITCLAAAVLVLPSMVALVNRRKARRATAAAGAMAGPPGGA